MTKKANKKTKSVAKAALSIPPKRDTSSIQGVAWLASSLIIALSLISFGYGHDTRNWLGLIGHTIGKCFHIVFGIGSYLFVPYFAWIGWRRLFGKSLNHLGSKTLYLFLVITSVCILLSLIEGQWPIASNFLGNVFYSQLWSNKLRYHLGGAFFYYLYRDIPGVNLAHLLNTTGITLIFSSSFVAGCLFLFKIHPFAVFKRLWNLVTYFRPDPQLSQSLETQQPASPPRSAEPFASEVTEDTSHFMRYVKLRVPDTLPAGQQVALSHKLTPETTLPHPDLLAIQPETNLKVRPSLSSKETRDRQQQVSLEPVKEKEPSKLIPKEKEIVKEPEQRRKEAAITAQRVHNGDFTHYALPSPNLLTTPKKVDQSSLKQDLRRQAEVLEETLSSFGIEAKVGQINCGPTITSFEVHPAIGVKVQKIRALENDIALNMEAKSIRIIAPIPGKAAVGIEVPNPQPQEVAFKDMLQAYQQSNRKLNIPILLGKAVNGDYVMSDLAKMPHCIIAGATGSGKSVCINTIVMSIVMNAKPDEIRLIMVDPKKVELTPYSRLPHMLAPVITEPLGACAALNWLVKEMERRYEILKQLGLRNIEGFNNRTINQELEESLTVTVPEKMYFIVGIIDELADLMMVASHDIETPIARIAQMARAVGIHLILATQRPSREAITGLIKANFPTRISFKVASRVNSQIVLDETGAESLLGNGDMLFLPPGTSTLVRAQGAFIRDADINAVVNKICEQAPPNYVIASFDNAHAFELDKTSAASAKPGDTLYDQAKETVLSTGNASTTFLQRKLKVGYARAASLMDELEARGVVGPAEGSKPRKILAKHGMRTDEDEVSEEEYLDAISQSKD